MAKHANDAKQPPNPRFKKEARPKAGKAPKVVDKAKIHSLLVSVHKGVMAFVSKHDGMVSFQKLTYKCPDVIEHGYLIAACEGSSRQRGCTRDKVERARLLFGGYAWMDDCDATDPWIMLT
jgi:hypothetical protein